MTYVLQCTGLPRSVMSATLDELMVILLTLSDNSELAQEIARAGLVQFFTSYLTTGLQLHSLFPVS